MAQRLVSAVPQLVWLSERKARVFGAAGVLLIASGMMLHRAARLPCPTEPAAAAACSRLRRISATLFWIAVAGYVGGAGFVLIGPLLSCGERPFFIPSAHKEPFDRLRANGG